jgi:hypothetical protein
VDPSQRGGTSRGLSFPFDPLKRAAVVTSLGGGPVRVCSRDDLVAMKRAARRSQDLLDLEELGES